MKFVFIWTSCNLAWVEQPSCKLSISHHDYTIDSVYNYSVTKCVILWTIKNFDFRYFWFQNIHRKYYVSAHSAFEWTNFYNLKLILNHQSSAESIICKKLAEIVIKLDDWSIFRLSCSEIESIFLLLIKLFCDYSSKQKNTNSVMFAQMLVALLNWLAWTRTSADSNDQNKVSKQFCFVLHTTTLTNRSSYLTFEKQQNWKCSQSGLCRRSFDSKLSSFTCFDHHFFHNFLVNLSLYQWILFLFLVHFLWLKTYSDSTVFACAERFEQWNFMSDWKNSHKLAVFGFVKIVYSWKNEKLKQKWIRQISRVHFSAIPVIVTMAETTKTN